MSTGHFDMLRLGAIAPSLTNPRKHFNAERLAELAASIKASGVNTPVLVRPLPASLVQDTANMEPRPTFELVTGERRYRASQMAGQATIPAVIRTLTDDQVLEIQIIENLQRDDLQPLEEAEGYEALMSHHDPRMTVDQVAAKIGKSRSYVYGRLKLLDLGTEGREALREGRLDASRALLLARIPDTKMQADALGNMFDYGGSPLSYREASQLIQRQYMLRLAEAKFKITDETLVPDAGSCRMCPKRTGADPDLFADVKGADVCTDPACFRRKADGHQEQLMAKARESGATIIEGREAKELIPHSWSTRVEGYLRLDDATDSPGDKPLRALIGKQMEKSGITPLLVANPHKDGELVAVITHEQAAKLLAAKGLDEQAQALEKQASQSARAAEDAQKRKDKEKFENAWRWKVMEEAWAKINGMEPGMYSVPEETIRRVALGRVPNQEGCKRLCKLLGLGTVAPAAALDDWIRSHPEPDRALALLVMYGDTEWRHWGPPENQENRDLMTLATDTGVEVDVQAVKKAVETEHKAAIKARNKVQAEQADSDPAKGSTPHRPAAQAKGVRGEVKGKGKGKKTPAAPAVPKTSEAEARTGIAAAMQGNEAGADDGPGGADPAGGAAAGELGEQGPTADPATGQQASMCICVGDEVIIDAPADAEYHGKRGVVHLELPDGQFDVMVDGETIAYPFQVVELKPTGSRVAWPMPRGAAA